MITKDDLEAAIAECLGVRNPSANTCIKLAAFYTIRNAMFDDNKSIESGYAEQPYLSMTSAEQDTSRQVVEYISETDFAKAINGMDSEKAWAIIDELVATIYITNRQLYNALMRKIEE